MVKFYFMRTKKLFIRTGTLLLIVGAALLIRCSPASRPGAREDLSPKKGELVIVSINDFHAALDRAEGLASVIRSLKSQYGERMLFLDGGDQFQGSLEGNMSKGKAMVEFFNSLGLDAAAIGNHDLDYGPDVPGRITVLPGEDGMGNLKARLKEAKYPWLSANLIYDPPQSCKYDPHCNALGQRTIAEARTVLKRNGWKIGIIGGTTPTTKNITLPEYIKGTRFEPLVPVIRAEANLLRRKEKCDVVLLAVHEGLRYGTDGKTLQHIGLYPVLRQLPRDTIDAVVSGHFHNRAQEVINGTPVVQTGSSAEVVGVLHLNITQTKRIYRFDTFIPVPDTATEPDVTQLLQPYRDAAASLKNQPVGNSLAAFPRYKLGESALGNLISDALLEIGKKKGGAQFGLINAGAIRANLPEGPLIYDHIFKVFPFENSLVVVDLHGKQLRRLLEVAFSGELGIPSVSGLQVKRLDVPLGQSGPWDRDLNGDGKKMPWERNVLLDVRDLKGHPLEDDQLYRLATITFLAYGGDYQDIVYDSVPPDRFHYFMDVIVREVIVDYIEARSPIRPDRFYSENHPRLVSLDPSSSNQLPASQKRSK
jgi:5'-nucleotidase